MDSRAKQRLTGAVILVALFVLLVPELLTGPRNAGGDAPNEEGMRRYTIDLDAASGNAQPMAPTAPAPAVQLPPVAEHSARNDETAGERAVPGESAQPATTAPTASEAPITPPAVAPTPVAPMASPPQAVASAPPPSITAAPVNSAARAEAPRPASTAATTPATAPAAPVRGGFAVQLGSFVSRENAERLVREMTAKGFSAFVAPPITTNGRALYRVRVGPTRDRASAEALAAQLRRIGQGGSIVSIS